MVEPPLIAVFGSSMARPGDGLYEQGVECGRLLALAGFGVLTGGYGGVMEAASKGAFEAGGRTVGVTVPDVFRERAGANEFVSEEVRTSHLMERIHELTEPAAGTIVLPGSIGTMAELGIAWNLAYVSRYSGASLKPIVIVGDMWREVVDFLGGRLATDTGLVVCVDDVAAAVEEVVRRL